MKKKSCENSYWLYINFNALHVYLVFFLFKQLEEQKMEFIDKEKSETPAMDLESSDVHLDNKESADKQKNKSFHVNRTLIPVAHLDDQASDELRNLGLDVFNQEDFEEGKSSHNTSLLHTSPN